MSAASASAQTDAVPAEFVCADYTYRLPEDSTAEITDYSGSSFRNIAGTELYSASLLIVLSTIAQTQESDQTLTPVSTMSIIA